VGVAQVIGLYRIRGRRVQLDCGEDGVKVAEVVREFKAVYAMADTSFDDKWS
jgi:hypothetical protein